MSTRYLRTKTYNPTNQTLNIYVFKLKYLPISCSTYIIYNVGAIVYLSLSIAFMQSVRVIAGKGAEVCNTNLRKCELF